MFRLRNIEQAEFQWFASAPITDQYIVNHWCASYSNYTITVYQDESERTATTSRAIRSVVHPCILQAFSCVLFQSYVVTFGFVRCWMRLRIFGSNVCHIVLPYHLLFDNRPLGAFAWINMFVRILPLIYTRQKICLYVGVLELHPGLCDDDII